MWHHRIFSMLLLWSYSEYSLILPASIFRMISNTCYSLSDPFPLKHSQGPLTQQFCKKNLPQPRISKSPPLASKKETKNKKKHHTPFTAVAGLIIPTQRIYEIKKLLHNNQCLDWPWLPHRGLIKKRHSLSLF